MEKTGLTVWQAVGIGLRAGLLVLLMLILYMVYDSIPSMSTTNFLGYLDKFVLLFLTDLGGTILLLIWFPAMFFGIIVAVVTKYWIKTRRATWIGAFLGSVLVAAGMMYIIANFCVGFC